MTGSPGDVDLAGWFADADEVVVTDNLGRQLAVAGPEGVASFLRALEAVCDSWTAPRSAPPVARLRLNVRHGDRPLGNIGLGTTFLIAHAQGTFLVRPADLDASVELLTAVGAGHLARQLSRRR